MREIKLPTLAGTPLYSSGDGAGTATKIAPPLLNQTEGKQPNSGFGAQWQNYIENALQRQIERSARLPFKNFAEVAAVPTAVSPIRFAYNKYVGATLIANGIANSAKYIQEFVEASAGAPQGITLAPVSGSFIPKDVVSLDFPWGSGTDLSWLVVGDNATATTKTLWAISRRSNHSEMTAPAVGSVENVCRDAVTGKCYAFSASTNRAIYVSDSGIGSWSVLGIMGAGADVPVAGATFVAANNGVLAFLYQGGPDTLLKKINTTSFSINTNTVQVGSTPLDVRWSEPLGLWLILTTKGVFTSSDLINFTQVYDQMTGTVNGGCLHDTGAAVWVNDGSSLWGVAGAGSFFVQDWLETSAPYAAMNFGTIPSNSGRTGVFAKYDGSAIWFCLDQGGTKRLFRSLRS